MLKQCLGVLERKENVSSKIVFSFEQSQASTPSSFSFRGAWQEMTMFIDLSTFLASEVIVAIFTFKLS